MSFSSSTAEDRALYESSFDGEPTYPDYLRKLSLEMDPDMALQSRTYPCIEDYYHSAHGDQSKAIQLQKGLSNFSSLQLGDDRISFKESILSGSYRQAVEDKMAIPSPSKDKTKHSRIRDYQEALKKVGDREINRLERVMKDKLFQRSYMTSSPFQVRKAFKFFDREQSMRISIEGFKSALEFLGFQFSELQNMALFGRYDTNVSGEIDYMNFIAKAMFYGDQDYLPVPKHLPKKEIKNESKNEEEDRIKKMEDAKMQAEAEVRRVFSMVDKESKKEINIAQFEVLLMALGRIVTEQQCKLYFSDMGIPADKTIPFELFYEWYQSDIGISVVPI